jgi:hypothetical protein
MAPAIGGLAVGRLHAIALPSLTKDLGARMFCNRLIVRQEPRPWRDAMVQEARDQGASPCPGRPSVPGKHPRIGRCMPRRLISHGAQQIRAGASSCGQDGGQHHAQKPMLCRARKNGTKPRQHRDQTGWDVHRRGPSLGVAVASLPGRLAAISP